MSAPVAAARPRLLCLIVARNLGDAVIQSGVLRALAARGFAQRYLVWARPEVAFLFRSIRDCEVICSQFPVGTTKQMSLKASLAFATAAWRVRRRRPSLTLDLVGDFRERIFARLVGTPRHLYIGWAAGHVYERMIRNPFGARSPVYVVPTTTRSIYAAYQELLNFLAPLPGAVEGDASAGASAPVTTGLEQPVARRRVGIHPFASEACRLWPERNWQDLVGELLARGADVSAFGAPKERAALQALFAPHADRVSIVTESTEAFVDAVAGLDVLVGLDSFSAHVAALTRTPSVFINGANNPAIWAPPSATVLAGSGGCALWPCYNKPSCVGGAAEYICIRSISVDAAVRATQRALVGGISRAGQTEAAGLPIRST